MPQQTYPDAHIAITDRASVSANPTAKEREYLAVIDRYTQAVRLNPDDALAYCYRGVAYYRLGDGNSAMADYGRSTSILCCRSPITVGDI